ncbi:MAG: insulinase family protein, partial [Kiritimatiellae bacterium]|nr:insulinase family protein [Kiritimatiellia bacterium]
MCCRRMLCLGFAISLAAAAWAASASPIETLKASRAEVQRFLLDNGMTCLVKEDHSAPVVAIQVWVGTGSIHEGRHLGAGLSHAFEHMVFKGTPTRPMGAITREISDAGGDINAYTSFDRTVFHAVLPSDHWRVGLEVLADAAMNANFPEEEWAKERQVILREIAMGRDNPDSVLHNLMWATAYTTHPYRHPVIGHEDIFRTITRDDLAGFVRENYVPDNMITVVAGDVDIRGAEAALRETFGAFQRRARPPVILPAEPAQVAPRFARKTGAYEVTRLAWSYPATDLAHPDTPALDVLASIVGAGRSSRLVQELREKQKLVLDIEAWSFTPRYPGLFGISASFEPDKEEAVLTAIQAEIDRWLSEPFSEEEVAKARRMALVSALSGLQTMAGQAGS